MYKIRNFFAGLVFAFSLAIAPVSEGRATAQSALDSVRYSVGLNKFDLPRHYIGRPVAAGKNEPARRVTRALARKALADAKDLGVGLMRVSMVGYAPTKRGSPGDLDLWRSDPNEFWRRIDEMMADLDEQDIKLVPVLMWNPRQYPAMAGEGLGDLIRNPDSESWRLLSSFVTEFITRYRNTQTIAFYELTNELNLVVDIDGAARCAERNSEDQCELSANISTDDLIAFTYRYAKLIRGLDSSRPISSGFSIPRAAAEHLRRRPSWSGRGANWSADNREQFAGNLKDIHSAVDIISIHLYNDQKNRRFGSSDVLDLLAEAKRVSDRIGKPLFVGEFGDPKPEGAQAKSHTARMIKKIGELRVPFSAIWVWQYRRTDHFLREKRPDGFSLDPGYTDYLIDRIRQANAESGRQTNKTKGPDGISPRVVLTWPLECDVVTGGQLAHATASDNSGSVDRVEFWLDDRRLGIDSTQPYEVTLSLQGMKPGLHALKARAFDATGNRSESTSTVLVAPKPGMSAQCALGGEGRR